MRVILDRFEGDYAIIELEDMSIIRVSRKLFKGANEGDVIDIIINHEETLNRCNKINKLMDDLFID